MKRVLITGADGFIGANLARHMLQDGQEVHILTADREIKWRLREIAGELQCHAADLRDADAVATVIGQVQPDWVFHLAASGAYSWQEDMRRIIDTNFLGTVNLVDACSKVGVERFVNTGSSSEYGFKDHAAAEDTWVEPNSYYAVAKASATLFCRYVAQFRKFPAVTLRLYSVFGPYEEPNRLMPSLIVHGMAGKYPPLVDPRIARDYVYVDDVVEAYRLAVTGDHEPGAVYNVGTGIQTTLGELVTLAQAVFDLREAPPWGSMPNRSWDTTSWKADSRRIEAIGWHPQSSLQTGFTQFVEWFHGETWRPAHYRRCLSLDEDQKEKS
jgi:nucleoside-diphosphate-sugar epimerase